MTRVYASQHIYANVEEGQSPHKKKGYQTLFSTRSALTEAEIETEIEPRLFYKRSESVSGKRVFFTTSTGKKVMANIVPLTGADLLGREGRYLAHSLVFSPEMFADIGADPFRVFPACAFHHNRRGGPGTWQLSDRGHCCCAVRVS
jgi:hypothetical protein